MGRPKEVRTFDMLDSSVKMELVFSSNQKKHHVTAPIVSDWIQPVAGKASSTYTSSNGAIQSIDNAWDGNLGRTKTSNNCYASAVNSFPHQASLDLGNSYKVSAISILNKVNLDES